MQDKERKLPNCPVLTTVTSHMKSYRIVQECTNKSSHLERGGSFLNRQLEEVCLYKYCTTVTVQ